ncbi:MAG TPA: serine/threonine-protein phosphatase, partial [Rhodospirillales bacterium]|nr:serine/threonine-protein phosphatase [Rhodospirillales bacterium]
SPDAVGDIETRYGISLQSHYRTSSELGGDFWGLSPLDDDRFSVFNVDFSGHGVSAAINTFRLHTLMKERKLSPSSTPSEHMAELNRHLATLMPIGQFATMFFGIVDIGADKVVYSGAAAPSPLLMTPGTDEPVLLDASGLPLGISKSASYKDKVIDFPAGSSLFLFSDALFESPDKNGDILQLDNVPGLVSDSLKDSDGSNPLPRILTRFYDKATLPLDDDLTAVWLSR